MTDPSGNPSGRPSRPPSPREYVDLMADLVRYEEKLKLAKSKDEAMAFAQQRDLIIRQMVIWARNGLTCGKIEKILMEEPIYRQFQEAMEETSDDLGQEGVRERGAPPVEGDGLSAWYQGVSPFRKGDGGAGQE